MQTLKARAIAFYLPQFHPIPENDKWWGKGFTEWTNVTKAEPLFKGQHQPRLPGDLGFYDLRVPEVRAEQAALARSAGVEGFCYWHYWFAGDRLLERPFEEVLTSGEPDYPFCLGWANHSWNCYLWSGGKERSTIKEQTYPGEADDRNHFAYLLRCFKDPRYIRIHGKPLFVIYRPFEPPEIRRMLDLWRKLAVEAGLPGLYIVGTLEYNERHRSLHELGFDAATVWPLKRVLSEGERHLKLARLKEAFSTRSTKRVLWAIREMVGFRGLQVFDYRKIRSKLLCEPIEGQTNHPMVVPNWDTTARYSDQAVVFHNSNPESFRLHLRDVLSQVADQPKEERILFVKSWNEWAEGNYLEPDRKFGRQFLTVFNEEIREN